MIKIYNIISFEEFGKVIKKMNWSDLQVFSFYLKCRFFPIISFFDEIFKMLKIFRKWSFSLSLSLLLPPPPLSLSRTNLQLQNEPLLHANKGSQSTGARNQREMCKCKRKICLKRGWLQSLWTAASFPTPSHQRHECSSRFPKYNKTSIKSLGLKRFGDHKQNMQIVLSFKW